MIRVDGAQVTAFAAQLRDVPKEMRTGLRRTIRKESQTLVRAIQGNASWSSRIPAAVRTRVGFGQRGAGVLVYVDEDQAPHARPLEGTNRSGINRHPVHGTDVWVDQPTRPFFLRAVRAEQPRLVAAIQRSIDNVWKQL